MATIGGIIYDEKESILEAKCGFEKLDFFRPGEESYLIKVPKLTMKEIRHLDKQLPCKEINQIDSPSIPLNDIALYRQIYRYFPAFVEAEIS